MLVLFAVREGLLATDIDEIDNVLRCNMFSVVHMTQMVLKGMVERKRGLIVHISSIVAMMQLPVPIYCATKAFVFNFHRSLQLEQGIYTNNLSMRVFK